MARRECAGGCRSSVHMAAVTSKVTNAVAHVLWFRVYPRLSPVNLRHPHICLQYSCPPVTSSCWRRGLLSRGGRSVDRMYYYRTKFGVSPFLIMLPPFPLLHPPSLVIIVVSPVIFYLGLRGGVTATTEPGIVETFL